jgi:hypothetical protein
MPVSRGDREYFERLGQAKAASHADAQGRHLMLSLDERLQRSWALFCAHRDSRMHPRDDDPTRFYDRARALGLYLPA